MRDALFHDFNEKIDRRLQERQAPFLAALDEIIFKDAMVINPTNRERIKCGEYIEPKFKSSIMHSAYSDVMTGGLIMERIDEATTLIREELQKKQAGIGKNPE